MFEKNKKLMEIEDDIVVDLRDTEDLDAEVDDRVQVRHDFFVREGKRLSSQEIDSSLQAIALSSNPRSPLCDIVHLMVTDFAYREARLSLSEFISRFKSNKLAELIVNSFISNLEKIDSDTYLKNGVNGRFTPSNIDVQPMEDDELHAFGRLEDISDKVLRKSYRAVLYDVNRYLKRIKMTSAETLFMYLRHKKAANPDVKIADLFMMSYPFIDKNGEKKRAVLKDLVVSKMYDGLEKIAANAYKEMFKDDKRGFVMGYMMGRVIEDDPENGSMKFNALEFRNLLSYLYDIGVDINNINGKTLYDLLYEEHAFMTDLRQEVSDEVHGVVDIGVEGEPKAEQGVVYGPGFNVQAFHERYIQPELLRFYSRKQREVVEVREPDLFTGLHDTDTLGRNKFTLDLSKYVRVLVETYKQSPTRYMAKMRELLGISRSPRSIVLSDGQVERYFTYCLDKVEEKYNQVRREALSYRKDEAVFEACRYPEPLLKCRSLVQLMEWFVYPDSFKKEFPRYSYMSDGQVAFACSALLRDFLRIFEEFSREEFVKAENQRDMIEEEIIETLDIKKIRDVEISFRIMEELDDRGARVDPKQYMVVVKNEHLEEFVGDQDETLTRKLFNSPTLVQVEHNGVNYHVCSEEKKKFKLVEMTIPIIDLDRSEGAFLIRKMVTVRALIYSGDDHYIHLKEDLTMIMSMDRGKPVTDVHRWLLSFPDADSLRAFKTFIYGRNPKSVITAEDLEENRNFSLKKKVKKSVSSTEFFKKSQDFKITNEVSLAEPLADGRLLIVRSPLETQAVTLPNLLIGNLSKFTEGAHDLYRAERAWPLLFDYYFPPEYFGDAYKKFERQGYDFDK